MRAVMMTVMWNLALACVSAAALAHLLPGLFTGVVTVPRHDGPMTIVWADAPLPFFTKMVIMVLIASISAGLLIANLRRLGRTNEGNDHASAATLLKTMRRRKG